jgi:putative flippase GtrA
MTRRLVNAVVAALDWGVGFLSSFGVSDRFLRFAIVGLFGLVWDTGTVYALRDIAGLYVAGTCGFLVSASINWVVNRLWTFRDRTHASAHVQWAKFLAANSIGFVFNRGTFFALVTFYGFCREQPVVAIIAGAIAGLCFNFFLSKRYVFG